MEQKKMSAWKNIRNLGTVSLISGWLYAAFSLLLLALGLFLIIADISMPSDTGGDPIPAVIYGVMLLIGVLFAMTFSVLQIIAGIKLRKPISKPKGWIITLVVLGCLGLNNLMGILTLVFGIIALISYKDIEGDQPPDNSMLK